MPTIQSKFRTFHETILLKDTDENAVLREKRDLLVNKLRAGLKSRFADGVVPTFKERNQGSYAMGTGIKPSNGRDYDIDVALEFNFDEDEYEPVDVKTWVQEILDVHPHNATLNRPCVTVQYTADGEDAYHIDFAIYAKPSSGYGSPRLAMGYPGSSADRKVWQPSDFVGLMTAVDGRFSDTLHRAQFKRVVRYMKRWKDQRFPPNGEAAPRGIGLTAAALAWFSPVFSVDNVSGARRYDDLQALRDLVQSMLWQFVGAPDEKRLRTPLPAEPYDDPFERMSQNQMDTFKSKLEALLAALDTAIASTNLADACNALRKQLGDDFPPHDTTSDSTKSAAVISSAHYG